MSKSVQTSSVKHFKIVFSHYVKQRILHHYFKGHKVLTIAKILQEEQVKVSVGITKFLKHYQDLGPIARKPGSGRPSKMTAEIKCTVDKQMRWWNHSAPAPPLTSQQRVQGITKGHPSPLCLTWMDILWVCLLPDDTRAKRSKEAIMGYWKPRAKFRRCGLDWWMYRATGVA